ncbi:MAG TPA: magnesium/cobalt transporter CorA [bacterium]|nr:magnesium/cobalt transporter CorA [bacterium]
MHLFIKASHKKGMAPGTLVPVVSETSENPVSVSLIEYTESACSPEQPLDPGDLGVRPEPPDAGAPIRWVIVDGVHDPDVIRAFGGAFNLHPLVHEDIMNTAHPVKVEEWDTYAFIVMKAMSLDTDTRQPVMKQISLIVGSDFVVSFHQNDREFLEPVKERLTVGKGRIRTAGAGYLAYALMDSIVDHYYVVLEDMNERMEILEESLFSNGRGLLIEDIQVLKRQLMEIRKVVWPERELFGRLIREESGFFPSDIRVFLQDVYDHLIHILDSVDTFRETLSSLMDSSVSMMSHRMNEVMKVLTIIATIFIPLTFIAGIYGMNFQWMPELTWKWGYPATLGVMAVIFAGMVIWFRSRRWL